MLKKLEWSLDRAVEGVIYQVILIENQDNDVDIQVYYLDYGPISFCCDFTTDFEQLFIPSVCKFISQCGLVKHIDIRSLSNNEQIDMMFNEFKRK